MQRVLKISSGCLAACVSMALTMSSAFAVSGENCVPAPSDIKYRPSLFECNGNAAVLMGGVYRDNFSVVLRALGQFNDRDPNNPSCGTNRCSPYKTQRKIELPQYQVNCLGENGRTSGVMQRATRISVKYQGLVTNSSDPRQFQQYCVNVRTDLN